MHLPAPESPRLSLFCQCSQSCHLRLLSSNSRCVTPASLSVPPIVSPWAAVFFSPAVADIFIDCQGISMQEGQNPFQKRRNFALTSFFPAFNRWHAVRMRFLPSLFFLVTCFTTFPFHISQSRCRIFYNLSQVSQCVCCFTVYLSISYNLFVPCLTVCLMFHSLFINIL